VSWREDLRRVSFAGRQLIGASFRGVPFFVDTSERSGGRRTVKHEFPYRDDPFYEDLGRTARTFRVDGYVVGADYLSQRDALMTACEDSEGPGELVHPYHGVKSAICSSMGVSESRLEGGFAKFSLEFCETPAQAPAPTAVVDASDQVSTSADAAITATKAELVASYDSAHLPAFALASAEAAITKAAASLQSKLASVISATQEAATLTGQISLMTAEASSLARQPDAIFTSFHDAITSLRDTLLAAPGAVFDALTSTYGADLGEFVPANTATRARELANQVALTGALRRIVAIEAARLAPLIPYVSIDEAVAARDVVAAQLEEQAGGAGDTAYPALVDLRSQVLSAVPGGQAFASVVTVTRNVPIPSLLLAYQLYGSVDLEADLIARNDVKHPGFVAGDLKVLSNG
jgi:prophage DNA circulation protein